MLKTILMMLDASAAKIFIVLLTIPTLCLILGIVYPCVAMLYYRFILKDDRDAIEILKEL